jgi:hypothetical protein
MINFSNDDRTALNAFLNTDLGQKFIRVLEQSRPKVKGEDFNQLGISGATVLGYELALDAIDGMRRIQGSGLLDPKYIQTHED